LRIVLISSALLAMALAVAAVTVVAFQDSFSLPSGLWSLAEQIASPGEFVWWATIGGAFAGRPSGLSGLVVWVLGTAVFWFSAFAGFGLLAAWALSRSRRIG